MYRCVSAAALVAAVSLVSQNHAAAQQFNAQFSGFEELGSLTAPTGAILSNGSASLHLNLNTQAQTLEYTLIYSNVGTTAPRTGTVTQAHIHVGKHHVAGGIIVFFCTNLPFTGTGSTPQACPVNSGTVTGTLKAADVQAVVGQNVTAGDFSALVAALENDTAYGNIHTTQFTAGEIRGQIKPVQNNNGLYNLPAQNSQGNQNQP